MNEAQAEKLKVLASNLSRADEINNLQGMARAHKAIKKAVTEIYKNTIDAPAVLHVERILNQGQVNVLGKSAGAYKDMEMLAGQAETGLLTYELFTKRPKDYVEMAYATRANVKKGRPFSDKIPYDPVRSALAEFREQLARELTPRKGNPFPDSEETERARFDATVKAERDYLEKFLNFRTNEPEQKKQKHLRDFDRRMEKLTREIEPRQPVSTP